jgi:hypothetical protein
VTAPTPGTTSQDSRGRRLPRPAIPGLQALGIALGLSAFAGALLLIAADFTTLFEIKAVTAVIESVDGRDNHSWAMAIIGVAALPMAYGAARLASRPAMAALLALGIAAAVIVLAVDLPDVNRTGVVGERFTDAAASPRTGFYLESLGAALLIFSGAGGLVLTAPGRRRAPEAGPTAAERAAARERARRR